MITIKEQMENRRPLALRIGKPLTFPHHPGTTDSWRAISYELEQEVRHLGEMTPPKKNPQPAFTGHGSQKLFGVPINPLP